jgi:hypothetical protein
MTENHPTERKDPVEPKTTAQDGYVFSSFAVNLDALPEVSVIRINCTARQSQRLPPLATTALHGALGRMLVDLDLPLFEHKPEEQRGTIGKGLRAYGITDAAPPPLVLAPECFDPNAKYLELEPDQQIQFRLVLIGKQTTKKIFTLAAALERAISGGLGVPTPSAHAPKKANNTRKNRNNENRNNENRNNENRNNPARTVNRAIQYPTAQSPSAQYPTAQSPSAQYPTAQYPKTQTQKETESPKTTQSQKEIRTEKMRTRKAHRKKDRPALELTGFQIKESVDRWKNRDFGNTTELSLSFISPVRITHKKKITADLDAEIFWAALLRRLDTLSRIYGNGPLLIPRKESKGAQNNKTNEAFKGDKSNKPPFRISDRQLTVKRINRYSSRQGRRMCWPGVVGEMMFKCDATQDQVAQKLLAYGELVQIGKGTSFGFGRYRLDV